MSMMWVGIGSAVVGAGTSIYGATQSAKNGRPPPPRNLGNELQSIYGQANQFAGQNYNTQATYNPLLTNLNLSNYRTSLLGPTPSGSYDFSSDPDFAGMQGEYNRVKGLGDTRSFNDWLQGWVQDPANAGSADSVSKLMQQKQATYASTPQGGGAADLTRQAYNAANPGLVNYTQGLQSVMDRLNAAAPNGVTPTGYNAATASPTIAGPAAMAGFSGARATAANGGPLLNPLQGDAYANLGRVSPIQSQLNQQATSLLNTNGALTPAELENAQQSARSAYADRGLLRSNRGVGAEILSTDAAQRQRLFENAQFAAGVDQSGQSQLNQNRGYAMNVQGQGQNLSTTNAGLLTGTSTFNAGQRNTLGQYNAGQANNMAQYNASLLNTGNQFNATQQNQSGAFNAAASNNVNQFNANLSAQNLNDAWSRAMQYGGVQLSQAQNPLGLAASLTGATPDYTNSLLNYGSDVYNTNYNGAASAANSARNNGAALTGSGLGLIGQGVGAYANYQGMQNSSKMYFGCIPEGQRIDTPHGGVAVEDLKPGTRVIGYDGLPVLVVQLHAYMEDPSQHRFVCIEFEGGGHTLTLSDRHRVEGKPAAEWQTDDVIGGRRIKHKTWHGGVRRSYDIMTSDAGYRIHGVPVNSMIEEMASHHASSVT